MTHSVLLLQKRRTTQVQLTRSRMTIGSAPDNDIVVDGSDIAAHHACIDLVQGQAWIADLSAGHTMMDDIGHVDRVALQHGDEVAIGDAILRFIESKGYASLSLEPA